MSVCVYVCMCVWCVCVIYTYMYYMYYMYRSAAIIHAAPLLLWIHTQMYMYAGLH